MAEISQKMKARGVLIGILNDYRTKENPSNTKIREDVEKLKKFGNSEYIARTLLKEIKDVKSPYTNICAIFLLEAVDSEVFEKEALECLKDENASDDKKFFIISLLKQKGINFDVHDIPNYIKNTDEIAQDGVKDFLLNALYDPEVQIDLLDFYSNMPSEEKTSFLENLVQDFDGDNLANVLSFLVQTEIEQNELEIIIQGLTNTKSPYALEGLEYILNNFDIKSENKKLVKKTLKEIKFANPKFKNNLIIKDSKIYKCFIGFVDGQANFPLVISRKADNGLIDTLLITVNINKGIVSCMGFAKIEEPNFIEIIKRLFSDSLSINITPIAAKGLLGHYFKKNRTTQTELPFEYIIWKKLLDDVRDLNYDISEFLNKKLDTINLKESKVRKFACAKSLETWYYSYRQNEKVDEIIAKIEESHASNIEELNKIVSDAIEENFLHNREYLLELQSKLLIQSYAAKLANLNMTSSIAYSLCYKNPYLKFFITSIIDKSIYYYLSTRLFECEAKEKGDVFKKTVKTNFSKEELENLMNELEEKWNPKKE